MQTNFVNAYGGEEVSALDDLSGRESPRVESADKRCTATIRDARDLAHIPPFNLDHQGHSSAEDFQMEQDAVPLSDTGPDPRSLTQRATTESGWEYRPPVHPALSELKDGCPVGSSHAPISPSTTTEGIVDSFPPLVLTPGVCDSVKDSIDAMRTLVRQLRQLTNQKDAAWDFEYHIGQAIDKQEALQVRSQTKDQHSEQGDIDHTTQEDQHIVQELHKLRKVLEDVVAERENCGALILLRYKDFVSVQERSTQQFEAAFTVAGLISPYEERPDTPIPVRDVEEEYRKICAYTDGSAHMREVTYDKNPAQTVSPSVVEQRSSQDALDAYEQVKSHLAAAQAVFDNRYAAREAETAQNNWTLQQSGRLRGIPEKEFDVRWVEHIGKLTRQLSDAEDAYRKACIDAIISGCELNEGEASSVFDNDKSEGDPESWEQGWKDGVENEAMQHWIWSSNAAIGDTEAHVDVPEMDQWRAKEPEIWESFSSAAVAKPKAKIQSWRQACDRTGKEAAM